MNMRVFYENTPGRGEDAGVSGEHYAIVFDGLGGTGGITCRDSAGNTRTEAKIASNAAAKAVKETIESNWKNWNQMLSYTSAEQVQAMAGEICSQIKQAIDAQLLEEMSRWTHDGHKRYLPTTIAGWITFPAPEGRLLAVAIWAGDSRCYVIDRDVMRQMSVDDSRVQPGEDMMTEILLQESPPMSNTIGVDRPYRLNCKCTLLSDTALLFACTDGMYNSVDSPMHLEYYMRLAASGQENMQAVQTELESFIGSSMVIKDDSSTICALGYAPHTGEFAEISEMLYQPVDQLDAEYIKRFPTRPMLPDGDVDTVLRNLAKQLSEKQTFRQGLVKHIMQQIDMPDSPDGRNPGQELLNELRARVDQKRRRKRDEQARCDRQCQEAEDRLRTYIAGLRNVMGRDVVVGDDSHSPAWNAMYGDVRQRLNMVLQDLNRIRDVLYPSQYMGNLRGFAWQRLDNERLDVIDKSIHDLIVVLNRNELGQGYTQRLKTCCTSYRYKEIFEEPLDAATQKTIFETLVSGGRLQNSMARYLRLTVEDMDNLMRLTETVRQQRQQRRQADELDTAVSLTDADRELIETKYAIPYARHMVRSWYEKRQKPNTIELNEKMVQQCEERFLKKCWDIDAAREAYSANFEAFKEQVMNLWRRYLEGYAGWNCAFELPADGIAAAAPPEPEMPEEEAPLEEPIALEGQDAEKVPDDAEKPVQPEEHPTDGEKAAAEESAE